MYMMYNIAYIEGGPKSKLLQFVHIFAKCMYVCMYCNLPWNIQVQIHR